MDEFMTLDQLEELVTLLYRSGGDLGSGRAAYAQFGLSDKDRYVVLRGVVQNYAQNLPEQFNAAIVEFEGRFGKGLPIASAQILEPLGPNSPVFTTPITRFQRGRGRELVSGNSTQQARVTSTDAAPPTNAELQVIDAEFQGTFDDDGSLAESEAARLLRLQNEESAIGRQRLEGDRSRSVARQEEDRQRALEDLAIQESRLRQQQDLQQDSNNYNRPLDLIAGAPLTASRGNFASFARQRSQRAVTGYGFQDRADQQAFSASLESLQRQRELIDITSSRNISDINRSASESLADADRAAQFTGEIPDLNAILDAQRQGLFE